MNTPFCKRFYPLMGLLLLCCFSFFGHAQTSTPVFGFLTSPPHIDGKIDKESMLALQAFPVQEKSKPGNPDLKASYRLAYGADFIYLCAVWEAPSIITRSRAYQNGDGLLFMIGASNSKNVPAPEFYVLGFSDSQQWDGSIQWFYNKELKIKSLPDAQVATGLQGGQAVMEVLIPWKSVYPFNPFLFREPPGINLCLVKAIGDKEENRYSLVADENLKSEDSLRKWVVPEIQHPQGVEKPSFFLLAQESTLTSWNPLIMALVPLYKNPGIFWVRTTVFSGENAIVHAQTDTLKTGPDGDNLYISTRSNFPAGGYRAQVQVTGTTGVVFTDNLFFSVLSDVNPTDIRNRISKLQARLAPGTYNTLVFLMEEYESALMKQKHYETAYELRLMSSRLNFILERMNLGEDLLARQKGLMRRAFRSELDSSLRPYSLFIPQYYGPGTRVPLIVFLHDAGEDDQAITHMLPPLQGNFMVLAPHGRGTSNCFATPEALTDVREAIREVTANYWVDTTNIILMGYGMGGYGALRVYSEFPTTFKALSVLSANPNLANQMLKGAYPDFRQPKNLAAFKGKEVFWFQGTMDPYSPFADVVTTITNLKKAGATTFLLTEETSQSAMGAETIGKFVGWLRRVCGI